MNALKEILIEGLAAVILFVAVILVLPWLWPFAKWVDLQLMTDGLNGLLDLYFQYVSEVLNSELFS